MTDSKTGAQNVTLTLTQHGNAAGGTIAPTPLPSSPTYAALTLTVNSADAVAGMIETYDATGSLCTFSTTGTYSNNGTAAGLTGSYSAITGCAGESGTYALSQQCSDTITAADRRVMGGFPLAC